ncbi:uncharacterized protein EURHEDRAFT_411615 [Aspergillus ruber CBS 135680]|uniref:DNA repair protein XRCC4 n=1 Tax=Aspergillus ruber (strain CBS 135680) TaxID=1388766 RepID=A0A017SGJ5_ASPRC|nr:uncharacterized protein EURHEDRAFT_411615 [Aspergillus ruber CBS 135680]EYE95886.1 hypothetical protein EURHEDRAFT_411615 [Aspergillus ruber CBS 135680]
MPAKPNSASSLQILRIPRTDEPDSYVLLRVTKSSSDLAVVATEGESPYTGYIKQSRLKSLRAKSYQGSDEEWAQIVSYVFGQFSSTVGKPVWSYGIEVSANVSDSANYEDKEIVLTIRKRIQSITQRLGSISLKQDNEQAIELFDWLGVAAARAHTSEERSSSLADRCRIAEDTIQQLTKQLEELVHAKSHHEDQLVANFAHLLNKKKLKIRNQQRLLVSAKVDPVKVSEIQAATSKGRDLTQKNRRLKRNAREMSKDELESGDGFEEMQMDHAGNQGREQDQETDDEERSTPQPLEDEGDHGTTTDEESVLSHVEPGNENDGVKKSDISNGPMLKDSAASPPRRELPFARRAPKKEVQSQPHQAEYDVESTTGETDDDEL